MISGSFLTEPAIAQAIAYVNAVVPANLLALSPSVYRPSTPNAPTYPAGQGAFACYWPQGQCLRRTDSEGIKADISSCPNSNDWGLTYDDGPTVNAQFGTSQLITALGTSSIKVTFFVVGSNGIQQPSILKDLDDSDHELASHTWTHHPLTSLTNDQIVAELKYTEAIIFASTGKIVKTYRPPYGDVDDRVRAIATALGFRTIFWSTNSEDTSASSATPAPTVINSWFSAQPGFISLQHDISPTTVEIAINALDAARATTLGSLPQSVSQCQGLTPAQWYKVAEVPGGGGGDGNGNGGGGNGNSTIPTGSKKPSGSAGKSAFTFLLAAIGVAFL
jgi:peptidoglycan/xylan/chitin deacetylase (PgdA/CDA1 family)